MCCQWLYPCESDRIWFQKLSNHYSHTKLFLGHILKTTMEYFKTIILGDKKLT